MNGTDPKFKRIKRSSLGRTDAREPPVLVIKMNPPQFFIH